MFHDPVIQIDSKRSRATVCLQRHLTRTKIEGRENRYVERLRAERDARMEERGERESVKGALYKPRVQVYLNPKP